MKRYDVVAALAVWAGLSCAAEPTRPPTAAGEPSPTATAKDAPAPTPAPEPTPTVQDPPAPTPDPAPEHIEATPSPKHTGTPTAKSSAPVTMTAKLAATSADLTLSFGQDGADLTIEVWGVDGLKVTKPAAATKVAAVRKGQALPLAVEYTAPADRASNLSVSVAGTFSGAHQSRVQSFTIGGAAPPADAPAPRTDKDGRPIKIMKAK